MWNHQLFISTVKSRSFLFWKFILVIIGFYRSTIKHAKRVPSNTPILKTVSCDHKATHSFLIIVNPLSCCRIDFQTYEIPVVIQLWKCILSFLQRYLSVNYDKTAGKINMNETEVIAGITNQQHTIKYQSVFIQVHTSK